MPLEASSNYFSLTQLDLWMATTPFSKSATESPHGFTRFLIQLLNEQYAVPIDVFRDHIE